jgi:hypothetical protein
MAIVVLISHPSSICILKQVEPYFRRDNWIVFLFISPLRLFNKINNLNAEVFNNFLNKNELLLFNAKIAVSKKEIKLELQQSCC